VSQPEFQAPSFEGCYQHPDRSTGIRCQRCGKPICGECMNPASVGFQCPSCIRTGQRGVRQPRTALGGALSDRSWIATKVLLGVLVGLFVLNLLSRNLLYNLLALSNSDVLAGQVWRLVTYGFTTSGILGTAMIALVLWFVGRTLEDQLGTWRFVALFVLSGFGGATLLFLIGPPGLVSIGGASSAVIGLLAANGVIQFRRGEDIRPHIGLLVLLVLLNLVVGWGGVGWLSIVGGIVVGGLTGAAFVYAPRERRGTAQLIGLLTIAGVCLAAIAAKTVLLTQ
jgi:membrane associated rhomboid family serine protease